MYVEVGEHIDCIPLSFVSDILIETVTEINYLQMFDEVSESPSHVGFYAANRSPDDTDKKISAFVDDNLKKFLVRYHKFSCRWITKHNTSPTLGSLNP